MKVTSGLVALLVLCTVGLVSADSETVPSLIGNWTGTSVGHNQESGYFGEESYSYILSITEQQGRVFNGTLFEEGIKGHNEYTFSGIIGHDMRTLHLAEHQKGKDIGYLLTPDELELILLVEGQGGLAELCSLTRSV